MSHYTYIIVDNNLYSSLDSLIEAGVSENTIWSGIHRGTACWQAIEDPSDRRRRLIAFEPMKARYKHLMLEKYGDPHTYLNRQSLDERQETLQRIEESLVIKPRCYTYFQLYCTKDEAYSYAKACAWLDLLILLKRNQCIEWGFKSKNDFVVNLAAYLSVQEELPISFNSERVIARRCCQYKKAKEIREAEGWQSVLKGRFNNQNARKIKKEQGDYLVALMARPSKPPMSIITRLYNNKAVEKGWKVINKRTAEAFLNKPENVSRWYLSRHGKKAAYNELEISTKRDKASAPNMLWMMDGTPIDLYYKSRTRKYNPAKQDWEWTTTKWNRLNMFCIMDAHSWKIIGYHLSERENHVAVIEGLRDAVRNTMELPMQIMFDQSSANKYVNNVLHDLARYRTANKPYRARPKTLEALFGHFQQSILRYSDNWAGQNITAKGINSRVNPEALNEAMKNLPTREKLEQDIKMMVAAWNEIATEQREKPNYLYTAKQSKGTPIDWMAFSSLFYVVTDKVYKYQNYGIEVEINKQKYCFQTYDQELHLTKLVNQSFQIAYDPDTMDFIYLYKDDRPVLDTDGQPLLIPRLEKLPQAIGDYTPDNSKRVKQYLMAQQEGTDMLASWATEADQLAAEHGIALTPEFVHKEAYNRAEEQVKRQQAQDETDVESWLDAFNNPYKK